MITKQMSYKAYQSSPKQCQTEISAFQRNYFS